MSQILIVLSDTGEAGCAVDVEYCPPLTEPPTPAQRVAQHLVRALTENFDAKPATDTE